MKSIPKTMRLFYMAMIARDDPKLFGKIKLEQFDLAFLVGAYAYVGAPLQIELGTPQEPFAEITSPVPRGADADIKDGEILVKTYSENEPMREPLLAHGYFEDTGKRVVLPFGSLEIWRLTEKFYQDFATAYQVTFE